METLSGINQCEVLIRTGHYIIIIIIFLWPLHPWVMYINNFFEKDLKTQ